MAVRFEQCLHLRFIVEGRVIHDDKTVWVQFWDQHLFHPGAYGVMRAVAFKQHRRNPLAPPLCHDKIGALAVVAVDFSMHFFTALCPAVRPIAVGCKAALIKVNNVAAAVLLYPLAQRTQIVYSATGMTFRVPRRFFYGCQVGAAP